MRPHHLFLVAAAALVVLIGATFYDAFTASATVAASNLGYQSLTVSVNDLKPAECTMTVTSIKTGSGTFSATANNQLVLGSKNADTVTLLSNDCFVGGGPNTGSSYDSVSAPNKAGDQCVVAAGASVGKCTRVATRP